MFCPKCGEKLIETENGRLVCKSGQMELTQELENRLRECYETKSRKPRESKFDFQIGGNWFCPECGILTKEKDGCVRCPQCGSNINEFIFSLIEHHPHMGKDGNWR
jgi:uncharacterized Zn finger protein (UPF0148 family)